MAKSYYQQYNKPRVHVQVWTEANGPIPKGYVVDHINGDIHDNSLSNLRLATVAENIRNSKISVSNKTGIKGYLGIKPVEGIEPQLGLVRCTPIEEALLIVWLGFIG